MSKQARAGVRAARALLSLIEESSAEELEAAEEILGGQEELSTILRLLREFKEHKEHEDKREPLSVERFREIVRATILSLPVDVTSVAEFAEFAGHLVGVTLRTPKSVNKEDVLRQAFEQIEEHTPSPRNRVEAYIHLLILCSMRAGDDNEASVTALLRDLAIDGLTENIIMFPALHTLSQLRTRWDKTPLPYRNHEPRRALVTRLLADAERHDPKEFRTIVAELLRESLRAPTDLAMTMLREGKPKKANGE